MNKKKEKVAPKKPVRRVIISRFNDLNERFDFIGFSKGPEGLIAAKFTMAGTMMQPLALMLTESEYERCSDISGEKLK